MATERDRSKFPPGFPMTGRVANAQATLDMTSRGIRSSVVGPPRTVHGEGDQGFVSWLIAHVREKGAAGHVGDGSNRWPAVHVADAGRLFRLAVEQAPAGSMMHAVGDEGVAIRDIAEVVGRHLGLPTASHPVEDFGFLSRVLSVDQPASGALTRELLGRHPVGPGLLEDLDKGHYFKPDSRSN